MRFTITVSVVVAVFLLQLAVIGLDLWQLTHFYKYDQLLMALDCLVIPACAWNAWRLSTQTLPSILKTEREHRARMIRLRGQLESLESAKRECAEWMMRERGAILVHISLIEEKHPEQAALLRQRLAEAERVLYGNH